MYDWAANQLKLTQTLNAFKASGAEVTEEAVKAEYEKRGGLVLGDEEVKTKKKVKK